MKKALLSAVAGLALVAAPLAVSAQSYGHGGERSWRHSDRGGDGGALLAAGVFGLVLGAALASSSHDAHHAHYDHDRYGSRGYDQYPGYYQNQGYYQNPSYYGNQGYYGYQGGYAQGYYGY